MGSPVKTTIEMPDDLFRKAKAVAALRGQSMKDLITQLLQREIGAPPAASAGARKKAADKFSRELEALAKKVEKSWNSKQDAAGAVREQRRG
jgi:ribosomal protein L12E/L44/L45/RPP1/RPP2